LARNVLVTGASGGIGRAIAARFAADGDAVIITGRNAESLQRAADEFGARGIVCDAADPEKVAGLRVALGERLDVLINNAGGNTNFDSTSPPAAKATPVAVPGWNGWPRAGARTSTQTSSARC
jgi:3-oxoacyl-[acyl-carrier protein] reductase